MPSHFVSFPFCAQSKALRAMPEFQELREKYALHISLANQCIAGEKARYFSFSPFCFLTAVRDRVWLAIVGVNLLLGAVPGYGIGP